MIDIQIANKLVCVRCLLLLLLGSHPQRPTSLIGPVWQTRVSYVVPCISPFPCKVLPSLPTSFLKSIHSQYPIPSECRFGCEFPSYCQAYSLVWKRRQPWCKMSLLYVSLQVRLLWRGPCLVD